MWPPTPDIVLRLCTTRRTMSLLPTSCKLQATAAEAEPIKHSPTSRIVEALHVLIVPRAVCSLNWIESTNHRFHLQCSPCAIHVPTTRFGNKSWCALVLILRAFMNTFNIVLFCTVLSLIPEKARNKMYCHKSVLSQSFASSG